MAEEKTAEKSCGETFSICPVCRRRVPAERIRSGREVYMRKSCGEHGTFETVLWRGLADWDDWRGEIPPTAEEDCRRCADCRGLCRDHQRSTCCTLLEVTGRCNMNCAFCFAGECREEDPSLERVKAWIFDLAEPGRTFLQLSGGEPTVRDDLPEIVAFARKCGCKYIQLNSNGIRLAQDENYVRELAEAGLSFVFLQFDGVTEDVYLKLRKRPMMDVKRQAIENCRRCGIGVTLVPVIVPGVNEDQIGEIIRFGISCSPAVRGIHFQPVSYFGRIPGHPEKMPEAGCPGRYPGEPDDGERYTLDQLLRAVVDQSEGLIGEGQLIPSCCDHPMCGFHGDFVVMPDRTLMALTAKRGGGCCGREEPGFDPAEKNREFIGRRWKRPAGDSAARDSAAGESAEGEYPDASGSGSRKAPPDLTDMDAFLDRVKQYGFTLTSMAFQDAGNLDFERLRRCSLHVYKNGRLIPFCAYYNRVRCGDPGEV